METASCEHSAMRKFFVEVIAMAEKFVCDWDHKDEPTMLVRSGKRWYLSCEKHAANFSPSYVVPIAKSALMAEAFKMASSLLELLRAGKIVRIVNDSPPYEGWEFYRVLVDSDGPRICDIGYCVSAKRFISPLYFVPERAFDSFVKLHLNGWQFEILESHGVVSDEEELRQFVRNLHRR
jgi:hypothetical protein